MDRRTFARLFGIAVLATGLNGCSSMGTTTSLFDQLGGMGQVSQLAGNLVQTSVKDPRLAGLLGKVDVQGASAKVSDQLCSALGGGCKAPFSDEQIANAASKLNPDQKQALSDNFSSALKSIGSSPEVQKLVTKSLGSKLGGIMGALL